jgi:site-specific DNA recombinase
MGLDFILILRRTVCMEEKPTIKYVLYARKSTESDEQQALSIDSQIKEMLEMATKENINVTEIRKESHSAKDSGKRPVFNQLLIDVREGKFDGILCWAPDRLSRNAGDLGSIVDLMDQEKLLEIRTHGQKFINSPNEKFLLMILCSQAKLENDHKGENVKRGLRAKCEQGWRPSPPPLGYLHDRYATKGTKRIFLDSRRAPYIKKIFERVAYEHQSGRKILRWLNEETDFKTKLGNKIALSTIYNILDETFYYGEFEYPVGSDKWYQGSHDPIISKKLFEKARERLKRDNLQRCEAKEFAFTKLMKCGLCGSGITAQEKIKRISDGTIKRYVYYGCTQGKDRACKNPYIREEELTNQLCRVINQVSLDELGIKKQFEVEIERYYKFSKRILKQNNIDFNQQKEIDIKDYAKYTLREGSTSEKRDLLVNLRSRLIMENRLIHLES